MTENPSYEKIPQSLKNLALHEKQLQEMQKWTWVATEKIHGANFSFVYENYQLRFAKRKAYLSWQDDFFGFQEVVKKAEHQIIRFFEHLSVETDAAQYILYGELCGGHYPHPEVIPNSQVQAIQTGIYYSPDIIFCAFDVAFRRKEQKHYLEYQQASQLFTAFDILQAPILKVGKWQEVLNHDIRVNAALPAMMGLPALSHNLIEGMIIKPWQHHQAQTLDFRPVLKIKNPEFQEDDKFHEAQKWSYTASVDSHTDTLEWIVEACRQGINQPRLDSAISKIGALDFKNTERIEAIQQEMLEDVMQSFEENYPNWLSSLTQAQQEWILERVKARVNHFLMSFK
jgi:Rnl2 family RNA ligase